MLLKLIFLLCSFFVALSSWSYVDLNLSYTYSVRRINGVETEANPEPGYAEAISTGYILNWAWFMWEYTAIELNYSSTTQRLLDKREVSAVDGNGDPFTIKQQDSTVVTEVSGVGIRQAFASRKSRIIPSLAIGYAKYTTYGTTKYTFDFNGTEGDIESEKDKEVSSSSYAAFSLRFRITQLMGLTLAAKTVMPDFDTSQASDNMTYSAGFSWMF